MTTRQAPVFFIKKLPLSLSLWLLCLVLPSVSIAGGLPSNRVSDIQNTRHNFSATVTPSLPGGQSRNVAATTESEICVFCHTPHAAEQDVGPLWNRKLSGETYIPYDSTSMEATAGQPNGTSKLCLSCHDGSLAIGSVNVLNASFTDQDPTTPDIAMNIQGGGSTMPAGEGVTTGYTRSLGTDLTNDHPISFTFDSALAAADGELHDPQLVSHLGTRSSGVQPTVPLEQGQVQCISCHDPHIRSTDTSENIKFLRLNRLQKASPSSTIFDETTDIICLACHDKEGWIGSAHADELIANEQYSTNAAALREFPLGTQVWESACLACHDTHSVQGSRRLLREGTDGPKTASGARQGGDPAIEETCYACHSADGGTLTSQGFGTEVPDIKTDFSLAIHMPIASIEQPANAELHDIGSSSLAGSGKDFLESPANLGKGNLLNRHAECTDCHNPHRVIRNRQFNDDPAMPDAAGTHDHSAPHSNLASGVLRGTWGVEPVYLSDEFAVDPFDFQVKRGNPPINGPTDVNQAYVTREYQLCLKCHSNYAFDTPPQLGESGGGTPYGTNNVTHFTNQAMEFQAPTAHRGEGTSGTSGGAVPAYATNNHRSWHPVMDSTGRTAAIRLMDASSFLAPWNDATGTNVGTQTMYCSDCHGSNTAAGTVVPDGGENGNPWGPHGSQNNFLLKGPWDNSTGYVQQAVSGTTKDHLCFKCHNWDDYANPNNTTPNLSGFRDSEGISSVGCGYMPFDTSRVNLHILHADIARNAPATGGFGSTFACTNCHVAVPHGWKNKALLVNLNDVGPEVGLPPGTVIDRYTDPNWVGDGYVNGPYYLNAKLYVTTFKQSGNWTENDCGYQNWGGPFPMIQACDATP